MSDAGFGTFGYVFGGAGLLFALGGAFALFHILRRAGRLSAARQGGTVSEAQVLEAFTTRSQDGPSRRHVIIGFTAPDGREIRVEDSGSSLRAVGDHLTVRYRSDRPQDAVPTDLRAGTLVAQSVFASLFLVVFTCMGLFFALLGFRNA